MLVDEPRDAATSENNFASFRRSVRELYIILRTIRRRFLKGIQRKPWDAVQNMWRMDRFEQCKHLHHLHQWRIVSDMNEIKYGRTFYLDRSRRVVPYSTKNQVEVSLPQYISKSLRNTYII